MARAIELAKAGSGWVNPNPQVGAVIVKDGVIVGEGYHAKCGDLHAERNAFKNLKGDCHGGTIYVTLEPCCHYGKQPPCTEAIVEHGIAKVVIGSRDPNPLVAGKGVAFLKEHGIEVVEDFMRDECDELNAIFFHYITTGKPYVSMKYAMTMDGKIATFTGASKWITGDEARTHVHKIRSRYSAIMAGIGTVEADDPMLNARGENENYHQPLRVIVDSKLSIPEESAIVKSATEYKTVIACTDGADKEKRQCLEAKGINVIICNDENSSHVDLRKVISWLGENKYDSLLIEGGGQIHESALKSGIVNHAYAYIAPKIFGGDKAKTPVEGEGIDVPAKAAVFELRDTKVLGKDILLEYDIKEGMDDVYWNC